MLKVQNVLRTHKSVNMSNMEVFEKVLDVITHVLYSTNLVNLSSRSRAISGFKLGRTYLPIID